MKGYIYIYNKHKEQPSYLNKIEEMFPKFFNRNVRLEENKHGQSYLYNFTNENYQFNQHENFFFGLSGYTLETEKTVFEKLILKDDKDQFISQLGGAFSIALYEKQNFCFTVWNNVTRIEPIYYCETNDSIVIGTKAILVHLLAYNLDTPEYDYSSLISFLNNGYFCDDQTPFKGVSVLSANYKITVYNGTLNINKIDDYFNYLYTVEPDKKYYDELTETFLNSFSMLKRHNSEFKMGLTGGKDSRLIIAAIKNLGFDISVFTTGFDDTADVIVAKRIAEVLNINHTVNYPTTNNPQVITENVRHRAINTIKNSEGMLFAYENVGIINNQFNHNEVHLGGQGGELLKGGFATHANIRTKEDLLNYLKNNFVRYSNLLKEDSLENYYSFINKYIIEYEYLNYNDILNKFYLDFRCGRWSSSARAVYNMESYSYAPFFDAQLVRKAQKVKTSFGSSEQMSYNILKRIAPELINIPFAEDRWRFEKEGPYSRYDMENWLKRQPIYSKTLRGSFNWRLNVLDNLKDEFKEVILSHHSPLFDVINKEKIENLFENKQKQPQKFDSFLWSLYTATILVTDEWFNNNIPNKIESINVPDSSKSINTRKIPNIKLIPGRALEPVHQKVLISSTIGETSIIEWNNATENDRLYFKTFDRNFSLPPTNYRDIAEIENISNIKVRFEVLKHTVDLFSLEFFFIQYDEKGKIAQNVTTFKINNKNNVYKFAINKDPKAKFFRIAIKIKDCLPNGSFELYNLFIETI